MVRSVAIHTLYRISSECRTKEDKRRGICCTPDTGCRLKDNIKMERTGNAYDVAK